MSKNNKSSDLNTELKFKISESYKSIRTNIRFSVIKEGCKTIVISSSRPDEGKSTVSVNVAIALAQINAKVLLIDTDMRKPTVYRFLGMPNSPGLSNYLGGMNSIEAIVHATKYENLKVITAGSLAPNPSELLSSDLFQKLISTLEKEYDYIIFDSTPLDIVSDAIPVIKLCDGVILIARQNVTRYPELDRTIKNLTLIKANIIGIILNGDASTRDKYYKYEHNYYNI